jgi:hypothetical protein
MAAGVLDHRDKVQSTAAAALSVALSDRHCQVVPVDLIINILSKILIPTLSTLNYRLHIGCAMMIKGGISQKLENEENSNGAANSLADGQISASEENAVLKIQLPHEASIDAGLIHPNPNETMLPAAVVSEIIGQRATEIILKSLCEVFIFNF